MNQGNQLATLIQHGKLTIFKLSLIQNFNIHVGAQNYKFMYKHFNAYRNFKFRPNFTGWCSWC